MIGQPPGWTRHLSGSRIVLVPPTGIERGAIRYDERKTPLRRASAILDEQVAGETAFRVERTGDWERLVTIEGEHAAAITIHGAVDGRAVQRDLGIVFLDDAYALTSSYCRSTDDFAMFAASVRELTRGDSHFLGIRRRRFEYRAPAGWQARVRGFVAEWFPRDYPNDRATIMVWPAMPNRLVSAEAFVDQVARNTSAPATRETVELYELAGYQLVSPHDGGTRRLVVIEDDSYTYPMRLDAATRTHDEAFDEVVRSLRPIPRPAREAPSAVTAHWVE